MPSLVQLHQQYGENGFVILAITKADTLDAVAAKSEAEKWGINYRVVQDKGGKITTLYGVASFPTTYLIGADGKVVGGHVPDAAAVETMLKEVTLYKRPAELPKSLERAGAAFDAGEYAAAWKLADRVATKEGDEDADIAKGFVAVLDSMVADQSARARTAVENHDYVKAVKLLDKVQVQFKGTDHAKAAKELAKELEGEHKDGWGSAEHYLKLETAVAAKKRDKEKSAFAPAYRALAQKYPGTPLADLANRRATELEGLK